MVYRSKRYYYIKTERKIGRLCEGVSSDFCEKICKNVLKSFLWYLNCAILCSPGKPREQNRHTGGKHHEGF